MWSGPRNLSTAMMYAFGARKDCAVWDEPYYAAYLLETGLNHPMRDDILAQWPQKPLDISERLTGPIPHGKPVYYQKHMTQHMLPAFDREWMHDVTSVFLIRHPARVIASYHAKRESPSLSDIGFREQAEIYDQVAQHLGHAPIVIDSADIRNDPEAMLRALCQAIDLPFDPAMLSWPKGGHPQDGPWAPHWYPAVWNSTGFAGPEGPLPEIGDDLQAVLAQAMPYYTRLEAVKIHA
ncbi:MAG: HAD family hydrolase [Proteobacteria bacterium]|nr:HAD family hydrolase [Pseudomonadota bacterium]